MLKLVKNKYLKTYGGWYLYEAIEMPHSYVPSCVVAHMDPHSPTQGRVVGGVACYLLNCVELFWKMYMLGTLACDYLCVILAIKNHQETLQK